MNVQSNFHDTLTLINETIGMPNSTSCIYLRSLKKLNEENYQVIKSCGNSEPVFKCI